MQEFKIGKEDATIYYHYVLHDTNSIQMNQRTNSTEQRLQKHQVHRIRNYYAQRKLINASF